VEVSVEVGGSAAVQGVAADWMVMGVAVLLMIQLLVHTADVDMVM